MTAPLAVALVGYGFVGKVFHAPLIAATPGLSLHTVVSSKPDAVHADHPAVTVVPTLDAALANPDIALVIIATPNTLHATQAHAALAAGKHVVVDKPFTVTVDDAARVIAHAAQVSRVLSVFQNRRWDSDFLSLRAVIEAGTLGEITQYESHFDRFRPVVRDRWRERALPGSGLWYDLGPHLLDQALVLFGEPDAISADIALQRDGAQSDDYFHVTLRYARRRVILHASTLMTANTLRFSVHGTHGSFIKHGLDAQEQALKDGVIPGSERWGVDPQPAMLTLPHGDGVRHTTAPSIPGDYRGFYLAMRDAISGDGAVPVTPQEALRVMRWIDAGVASAERRCDVTVPPTR
jgi:predicted dehydrogenase